MARITTVNKVAQAKHVLSGIAKRFSPRKRYLVGGKRWTAAQIAAIYRAHLDAIAEADRARHAYAAAILEERAAGARVKAVTLDLKNVVASLFGLGPKPYADFGWKLAKKPGPKTTAAKLAGVQKRARLNRT